MSWLDAVRRGSALAWGWQACALHTLELRERLRKLRAVSRVSTARMLYRRRVERTAGHALILAYHRIAELSSDPQELTVTPERFARQLEYISARFTLVHLSELAERLAQRADVSGLLALTFDDGYADNLLTAKPLLERYGVPATVFVISSHIGSAQSFWWDELERLLLLPERIPQHLILKLGKRCVHWDFGDDAYFPSEQRMRYQDWGVDSRPRPTPTRRHRLYLALQRLLLNLAPAQRDDVLDRLRNWAGATAQTDARFRTLTQSELIELAASESIAIGAHTARHPSLSMLDNESQRAEIATGKMRLEEAIGRPVTTFAYPYGSLASYDDRSVELVRSLGFRAACTTFADSVRPGSDPLQLPRMLVRNWDGDELEQYLRGGSAH